MKKKCLPYTSEKKPRRFNKTVKRRWGGGDEMGVLVVVGKNGEGEGSSSTRGLINIPKKTFAILGRDLRRSRNNAKHLKFAPAEPKLKSESEKGAAAQQVDTHRH